MFTEGTRRLIGTIKKVEVKFAYVKSNEGDIYVPLSAAVPEDEYCPDLTKIYQVQDVVNITAKRQASKGCGKNSCDFLATRMRKANNQNVFSTNSNLKNSPQKSERPSSVSSSTSSTSIDDFKIARIVSVSETYAYANVPEIGNIFIPGGAFDQTEVKRLNSDLAIDENVMLKIEKQRETNGCGWKAIQAKKFYKESDDICGIGTVVDLTDLNCKVYSKDLDMVVHCSLLTYIGGDKGKNAETLPDVVKIDDIVMFKLQFRENLARAVTWKSFDSKEISMEDIMKMDKSLSESYTQTVDTLEDTLLSMISIRHPEVLNCYPALKKCINPKVFNAHC